MDYYFIKFKNLIFATAGRLRFTCFLAAFFHVMPQPGRYDDVEKWRTGK